MRPALSLSVAPTSGVPIYRQLVDQIRAQIVGGRFAADAFLPSVRQVADELQVNPMTVSKAYSILEREGVVELVRGQGMRVLPPGRAADARARERAILPLLRQVAEAARDLSLTPEQVMARLQPLLKGTTDGDDTRDTDKQP
jgi:GntR family transcriptional regulator